MARNLFDEMVEGIEDLKKQQKPVSESKEYDTRLIWDAHFKKWRPVQERNKHG